MCGLVRFRLVAFWTACTALFAGGCETTSPLATWDAGVDAAPDREDATSDAQPDASDAASSDDTGSVDTGVVDTGSRDAADTDTSAPAPPARYEAELTYATANIGRNYNTKSEVQAVFNKIGDFIGPRMRPKFVGWQEIGEGDPCGRTCEIDAIHNRFKTQWGWTTHHLKGLRPDGNRERAKVPITSKGVPDNMSGRAVFASPGWAHVSPTRFVTVVYYAPRNLSVVNTHLIAGAWSCKSHVAKRRDYWRRGWRVLQAEVAKEHDRGRNVIVTGDLNRPRHENNCNPAWNPESLHSRAKIIAGAGIDYIFAVPATGYDFEVATRGDGSKKRGSIRLGIDGHKAHWVGGRFLSQ